MISLRKSHIHKFADPTPGVKYCKDLAEYVSNQVSVTSRKYQFFIRRSLSKTFKTYYFFQINLAESEDHREIREYYTSCSKLARKVNFSYFSIGKYFIKRDRPKLSTVCSLLAVERKVSFELNSKISNQKSFRI